VKQKAKTYKPPSARRRLELSEELQRLVSAYAERGSKRSLAELSRFARIDNPFERGFVADALGELHDEMPEAVERAARELARSKDRRVGRIGANALNVIFADDYAKCKRAVMGRLEYDPDYVQAMLCGLCHAFPGEAAQNLPKLLRHRARAVRLGALHGLEAIGLKYPKLAFDCLDEFRETEDEVEKFWVKHVLALNLIPQKTAFSLRRLRAWLKEGGEVGREIVEEAVTEARKQYAAGKEKVPGLYEKLKDSAARWAEDGSAYVSDLGEKLKKSFKK